MAFHGLVHSAEPIPPTGWLYNQNYFLIFYLTPGNLKTISHSSTVRYLI